MRPTYQDALGFYEGILNSLLSESDDNGLISGVSPEGDSMPVMVVDEGVSKRLVLPTRHILRNFNHKEMMAFHPLSENIYAGESVIIKKLKRMIMTRLNFSTMVLLNELLMIACDKDMHDKLSAKQTKLLECIPDADDTTLKNLGDIIQNSNGKVQYFNLYLKHGGKYHGKDCSRLGVVTFPILEEMEDEKKRTVFGVKLRVKDFKGLRKLLEFVFPNAENLEAYNHGVLSEENESCPYFRALMGIYHNLGKRINEKAWLFRKYLDDDDPVYIPLDWYDHMDKLDAFKVLIPSLHGNEGHIEQDDTVPKEGPSKTSGPSWGDVLNRLQKGAHPINQNPPPTTGLPWLHGQQQQQVQTAPPGYYPSDPRLQPQQPQGVPPWQNNPQQQQQWPAGGQPMGQPQQPNWGRPQGTPHPRYR